MFLLGASFTENYSHCGSESRSTLCRAATIISSLLVNDGSANLLLSGLEQKGVSLSALVAEVAFIGQQAGEVDHLLVDQHTSNSTSILAEVLFDDGIDGITNEVLSFFNSGDLLKVSDVDLGKGKGRKLSNGVCLLALSVVVRSTRAVASLATAVTTSVTSVSSTSLVTLSTVSTLVATLILEARAR